MGPLRDTVAHATGKLEVIHIPHTNGWVVARCDCPVGKVADIHIEEGFQQQHTHDNSWGRWALVEAGAGLAAFRMPFA